MSISEDMFYLDPSAEGTLQKQIQSLVAEGILSGRFRSGEHLPSSRRLARRLGVRRITVTLAYAELQATMFPMRHLGRAWRVRQFRVKIPSIGRA